MEPIEEVEFEDCEVLAETERAICVVGATEHDLWVPRSVLGDANELESRGDVGMLSVWEWWAIERGIV